MSTNTQGIDNFELTNVAAAFRNQFPIFGHSDIIQLDNAATSHKPQVVLDAIMRIYSQQNANVHRGAHSMALAMTEEFEQARITVAEFLNATADYSCIWTRGVTEGINLLAATWGRQNLSADDNIILSAMEHHANIVPWQLLAEEIGFEIRIIPLDEKQNLNLEAYRELLDDNTKLVGVCHVSNVLGAVNKVAEIAEHAHAKNAIVVVDGAQAVAHMAVDVHALGVDAYLFSGHKMYAPTGIGVLCIKASLLENCPPYQGGGEMVSEVSYAGTSFADLPLKYEAGTPAFVQAAALAVAIAWQKSLHLGMLRQHQQQLYRYALASLLAWNRRHNMGLQIFGSPSAVKDNVGIIAFNFQGHHPQDVAAHFNQQKIALRAGSHCAMPLLDALQQKDGVLRIALGAYNTESDINAFLDALDSWRQLVLKEQQAEKEANSLYHRLLQQQDPAQRYQNLLEAGKERLLRAKLRREVEKKEHRIRACESDVWLYVPDKQKKDEFKWHANSSSKIIRGLLLLIMELCPETAAETAKFDFDEALGKLGLKEYLGLSRSHGVRAIIKELQKQAAKHS